MKKRVLSGIRATGRLHLGNYLGAMMKIVERKPIGVVGGMGPDASLRLVEIIFALAKSEMKVKENHEFPELILHSIPVVEFVNEIEKANNAKEVITEGVGKMRGFGIGSVGIACNTVHVLFEDVQEIAGVPLVSMIEEVMRETRGRGFRKIGLLASPVTIKTGLYERAARRHGVELVVPSEKEIDRLGKAIVEIIGGEKSNSRKVVVEIARGVMKRGVEGVVLGCTELPLVFPGEFDAPVINSLDVLAKALLKGYYQKEEI